VAVREQHSGWELLDMAARETIVSGLQEGPMMREAREAAGDVHDERGARNQLPGGV
jgi:hypothetical protein